jgi:hypothetical protein
MKNFTREGRMRRRKGGRRRKKEEEGGRRRKNSGFIIGFNLPLTDQSEMTKVRSRKGIRGGLAPHYLTT